jgi:hypothetical protein
MKWHQLFSTLLQNLRYLRAIQWTLKRKNKQYSDQLGGKERWLNKESVNGGQCGSKKDNQWTSTFRSHRGQYCSKTFHDLVNSNNNWKQHCTWGTTSYLHLGVTLWNMAMTPNRCYHVSAFKWTLKECTPSRLTVRPSVLKIKSAFHGMNTGDKLDIIDEANTFLFAIWFNKIRGIHWEEHWAYNKELFTTSYKMHVWMTWQFQEGWW